MSFFIFLVVIFFLICFLRGSIYLHLYYIKNLEQDYFEVKVYLFDFWKIHQEIRHHCLPMLMRKGLRRLMRNLESKEGKECVDRHCHKDKKWSLVQKISKFSLPEMMKLPWVCRNMSLEIKVSSEDAARTAILYGGVQALMPVAYRWLSQHLYFKTRPCVRVMPCFECTEKEFLLRCIISVKIGNLVHILRN